MVICMAPTEMNTDCLNDGQTLFSKDGTISLLTFSPLKSGSALDLKSGWLRLTGGQECGRSGAI